jgi:hypothetical protein
MLSAAAGIYTFHADPGALSAAFVWQRTVRALLSVPIAAHYVVGGWSRLVASLEGVPARSASRSSPARASPTSPRRR